MSFTSSPYPGDSALAVEGIRQFYCDGFLIGYSKEINRDIGNNYE